MENRIEGKIAPLLPVRDVVVFPHMVIPLFVGRPKSLNALEDATMKGKLLVVSAQKDPTINEPTIDDIYRIGTLCQILQMLKLPDGTVKVLVEGINRVKIEQYVGIAKFFEVQISEVSITEPLTPELEALMRDVVNEFDKYVRLHPKVPPETAIAVSNIDNPGQLADVIASHMVLKLPEKQSILETLAPSERLRKILEILVREVEILEVEKKIHEEVRGKLGKTQKEYYLREQLHAIQKELGEQGEQEREIEEYREKIKKARMPAAAKKKALQELSRLQKMPYVSAEATVVRTYIEWLVSLPWAKRTRDRLDIGEVEKVLNEDHYGLEKVKERILEYLATRKLSNKMKGQIICFVGPPGVGKTSLGRSIARALGRKFVQFSLGGVRDEAEIRGHRRTYIGAMPGRIIQKIKQAGTKNPVFLLDEVDKIGVDFRGDPAAALLEALDPEQNSAFSDHYLEVPFDLSEVMFITTANVTHTIPRALLDRMEVIHMPGYTEDEKLHIAKLHLLPKQMDKHGLVKYNVRVTDGALLRIVREYTREAGVRNLEREIATLCRKAARKIVQGAEGDITFTARNLSKFLGPPKYHYGIAEKENEIGVSTGLAWTETGGEILFIESVVMPGKGNLILTGNLGDVMQESARAAMSYIRAHSKEFGVKENFYEKYDVHIHVPEGAIPKDGPSAGIAMFVSMLSAFTKVPVRRDVAMTGEITLRGKILAIGGVKEKVLAAHRAGVKKVIMPVDNKKDCVEIPEHVKKDINFVFVERVESVIKEALVKEPRRVVREK